MLSGAFGSLGGDQNRPLSLKKQSLKQSQMSPARLTKVMLKIKM